LVTRRRLYVGGLVVGFALAAGWGAAARIQETSLEYPIKAAFLYKFGSFVEWPPEAFPTASSPVNVCVVGRDPFGPVLDRTVRGQTVGARPVTVRRLSAVTPASGCHIAYLGGSPEQSVSEAARTLSGAPVLTVTDGLETDAPAAVRFTVLANRVRFKIDLRTAARNGVSISSKLLNLAVEVVR
jgi:hypothetical protein